MTVCGIQHADGICVMGKCPYVKKCCPAVWDKSGEPQTNEEWFCQLSTEEKAKVLRRKTYGNGEENEREEQGWVNWLKVKHEDNPPDIHSVPSWDRWLQGEKTKCELCDGSGEWVECNLVGRFECPKTPKTEQKWLQTATTEQLAEWLLVHMDCVGCPASCKKCHRYYDACKETMLEWLKQPHKGSDTE